MIVSPQSSRIPATIIPTDTSGPSTGSAGAIGVFGSYNQIIASTANNMHIVAAYINNVFTESSATYNQDEIDYQVEFATGASTFEDPFALVSGAHVAQFTYAAGATAQIASGRTHMLPPFMIPAGTRIAARLRYNNGGRAPLGSCYLIGYETVDGFPVPGPSHLLDPTAWWRGIRSAEAKSLGNGATCTGGSPSWTSGSWVEFSASMPADALITEITIGTDGTTSMHVQGDIGVGAGTPEVIERFAMPGRASLPSGVGVYVLPRPAYFKKGERLSLRVRTGPASKIIPLTVTYFELK